jgi:FG-GAP repeat
MSTLRKHPGTRWSVLFLALCLGAIFQGRGFSQQPRDRAPVISRADEHAADPCEEHPPDGKAVGWEHHCPPVGTSNGIARGDFNGDGFADLAIGVPFDDVIVGGVEYGDAGAVNVVYGSNTGSGLTAFANQYWHRGQTAHGFIQGGISGGDNFGTAVAAVNFNGDAYSDLVVGAPFETVNGVVHAGAVHVILGGPNGLTAAGNLFIHQGGSVANLDDAPEAHDHFGETLTWGLLNGDTLPDLVIGVPDEDIVTSTGALITDAGAVVIVFGPVGSVDAFIHQEIPDIPTAAENFDHFGDALTVGDFNNDNWDDLVIGTPFEDLTVGGVFYEDAGLVTILYGGGFFLTVNPPLPPQAYSQGSLTGTGSPGDGRASLNAFDHFSASLAAGDFNGDGYDDLAVGVPREDVAGQLNAGAVNVLYGSISGVSRFNPDVLVEEFVGQPERGDQFGFSLAAGDFDRDGYQNLAIGAPYEDLRDFVNGCPVDHIDAGAVTIWSISRGRQYLFQGGSSAIAQPRYQWGGNRFGFSLTAWNFGRGANADLAVGVPGDSPYTTPDNKGCVTALPGIAPDGEGTVEVLYGPLDLASSANQRFSQSHVTARSGVIQLRGVAKKDDNFGRAVY